MQPNIAHYRLPLYQQLFQDERFNARLFGNFPNLDEAKARVKPANNQQLQHLNMVSFMNQKIFWQKHLKISHHLDKGDVLVLSGNPRFLSNYPLILSAKMKGIKILWWGHGWTAGSNAARTSLRKFIMRRMDAILLYTADEAAAYIKEGFTPETVFYTGNALDQKPILQAKRQWKQESLEAFKAANNIPQGEKIFLFCGRLTQKTDLTTALEAVKSLNMVSPEHTLIVIGDGDQREFFQRYNASIGGDDKVRWLGPLFNENELAPWFLISDAFLYPGAIGLSILHAFWYALPVVTHSNPKNQMPEFALLKPGKNGLTFTERDVDSLRETLSFISQNPETLQRYGASALDTVRSQYTIEQMYNRFSSAIISTSSADR